MSNSRLRDCNLQSGTVLWLRHSFARAFSGDSTLFPLPCGGGKGVGCHVERSETSRVIASSRERTRQPTVCKARIMRILCLLFTSATPKQ